MKNLILVASLLGVSACSEPETFNEIADVTGVAVAENRFEVDAQIGIVAQSLLLTQIGTVANDVAAGVQAEFPEIPSGAETLRLKVHFDATDRLGNETAIYAGAIDFQMSDVRNAKLDNLPGEMFLDLAVGFEFGDDASEIASACIAQGLADLSPFCRMLSNSADALLGFR